MNEISRRAFLSRLSLGLTAAIAGLVGLPIVGYLLAPLVQRPPDVPVAIGAVSDFPLGQTRLVKVRDPSPLAWAGQTAETALWVRRRNESGPEMFQVFNMGHRMEVYCDPRVANDVIGVAHGFGIDAKVVGEVRAAEANRLTIVADGAELTYEA